MNSDKRLTRIETSLKPLQAVLRWLKETLELSYEAHLEKMFADPRNPRAIVVKPVGEAVLENLGEPPREPEVIQHAAREAMKRADMLMVLIVDLHDYVRSKCESIDVFEMLLSEKRKSMLQTFRYRGKFNQEDWDEWGGLLNERLVTMWRLKETVVSISAKYYDGHPLLFAADEEKLNGEIEYLEKWAQIYNCLGHELFNSKVNQIGARSSSLAENVEAQVTILVDLAKAKTLIAFGEEDAARKLLDSCVHAGGREVNRLRSLSSL